MKLQPASKKEVKRIAIGCGILAVGELAVFFIFSLLGIGTFNYRVFLGTIGGSLVSIENFALMCLMIQNATGIKDEKLLKAKVKSSYNFRLLIQALWLVLAMLSSSINMIAAAIPLLFPTAIIYYLQTTGKLIPATGGSPAAAPAEEEADPEDDLNSFEV